MQKFTTFVSTLFLSIILVAFGNTTLHAQQSDEVFTLGCLGSLKRSVPVLVAVDDPSRVIRLTAAVRAVPRKQRKSRKMLKRARRALKRRCKGKNQASSPTLLPIDLPKKLADFTVPLIESKIRPTAYLQVGTDEDYEEETQPEEQQEAVQKEITPDPQVDSPDAQSIRVPTSIAPADIETWKTGLASWRTKRTNIGAACADCHAPDAIDLAFFNVSDEDIRRRGIGDGLAPDDVENVVKFISFQRARFNIEPKDRHSFRLLQPGGGKVLPGATRFARDLSFINISLKPKYPLLFKEDFITNMEDVVTLTQQLGETNFHDIAIGVELPLWMSDGVHGKEKFGSRDEWVPNLAGVPNSPEYFDIVDTYLENPTRRALYDLLKAARTMITHQGALPSGEMTAAGIMEKKKFGAMMLGQHIIRKLVEGKDLYEILSPTISFREFLEWEEDVEISDGKLTAEDMRHIRFGKVSNTVPFITNLWDPIDHARKPQGARRDGLDSEQRKAMAKELGIDIQSRKGRMFDLGYPMFFVDQAPNIRDDFFRQGQNQKEMMGNWVWVSAQVNTSRITGYAKGSVTTSKYPAHRIFRGLVQRAFPNRFQKASEVSFESARPSKEVIADYPELAKELKLINTNSALLTILNTLHELRTGLRENLKHAGNSKPSNDHAQALISAYLYIQGAHPELIANVVEPAMVELQQIVETRAPGYFRCMPWFAKRVAPDKHTPPGC